MRSKTIVDGSYSAVLPYRLAKFFVIKIPGQHFKRQYFMVLPSQKVTMIFCNVEVR